MGCFSLGDDQQSAQKALQTVVIGQQAENLLNFDDPSEDQEPSGIAATAVLASTPAAANLLAGTSSNPLDDLVSIFGNVGLGTNAGSPAPPQNQVALSGLAFGSAMLASSPAPGPGTPSVFQVTSPTQTSPPPVQQPQDDLLGLF